MCSVYTADLKTLSCAVFLPYMKAVRYSLHRPCCTRLQPSIRYSHWQCLGVHMARAADANLRLPCRIIPIMEISPWTYPKVNPDFESTQLLKVAYNRPTRDDVFYASIPTAALTLRCSSRLG